MNKIARACSLLLLSCLSLPGQASMLENIRPFFAIGYDSGGETLFTTEFDNGSKHKINTHGGISLASGAVFSLKETIELQASLAYKFDSSEASNGEVSFQSFPLEILLAKRFNNNHRLGLGLVHTFKNEFDCDIDGICNFNEEFKDSNGLILQYDYTFTHSENTVSWRIGARYTRIDLESKIVDQKVEGDGLGIVAMLLF